MNRIKSFSTAALVAAIAWFGAGAALAQPAVYAKVSAVWFQQGKISGGISVSNSSAATQLPNSGGVPVGLIGWICNTGSNDAYLAFGTTSGVTATVTGSSWLKNGTCAAYDLQAFTTVNKYVAAITASSTTTLTVETGIGTPPNQGGGSGGGGGGLSVVDNTAFTAGTSSFTPGGGFYNSTPQALSNGDQGTFALSQYRSLFIDTPTSNNNLYSALTGPVPCKAASTWNASTGLTGTQPTGCDGSAALWGDIGAAGGTVLGNWGTPPGAVPALPTNAYPSNGTLALGSTFVKGTTAAMTGTTSTQIIAAVTSNRIYVTAIKCNNSSATATLVQIQDGSGGTVLETLAAGATYGGEARSGSTPLFWTTSGNGLYAADVTTGASVICTASGYSG